MVANNINPLFIKFKMKYSHNLHNVKNDFLIQFQRYDNDKCPGHIQVSLLQKIMEFNQIKLEIEDQKFMQKRGITKSIDGIDLVDYKQLIKQIFPDENELYDLAVKKSIGVIMNVKKMIRRRRELK